MAIKINIIVIQLAAILVLILVLPLGLERFFGNYSYLSAIRYILAGVIAIPTVIYAIKEYRKTSMRAYVFPCFIVALGFWVASMFFMQQRLPDGLYQNNLSVTTKQADNLYKNKPINNTSYFYLTRSYYSNKELLLLNELPKLQLDTASLRY